MSCSRLLDSSPPSRPLPSPAGPHGFYKTPSPQSPVYSFLGVSLWTLRHSRRYASRPFRFTLHRCSLPCGEGIAVRELNSPLFKIRSRGTSCFRTPDSGPVNEPAEAASLEDWPPPHAASRLPTPWFLTTSPVQVPVPFGDCCTPAGQDSHRFRFKSRLSSTSSTPSTTRSVAESNNERRYRRASRLDTPRGMPLLSLAPPDPRSEERWPRWAHGRCTPLQTAEASRREHRVLCVAAVPDAHAPFEERHSCSASHASLRELCPLVVLHR